MFNCRRFLQIGTLSALLAGCATSSQTPQAQHLPAQAATGQADRVRIGPDKPVSSDEGPATLTPTGELRPDVRAFAEQLAAQRELPLPQVLASLESTRYNATVARLIAPSGASGKKIWRSWLTYRGRFVEPKRIAWGVEFWNANQDLLNRAAQRYGVPASIIASIIGVETLYGRNVGNFRVVDALATLAFDYLDPAKPERADMFRGQLGDFITLALQDKLDPETRGSYAGAIGMPQFMPGSIMRYAVDGDDDGHIDLTNSVADAVMSVGNFLVEHGWQRGLPVFAPVALPADPAPLVAGGLTPTLDWNGLQAAGARPAAGARKGAWQEHPMGIVDLVEEARGTVQYRTATPNFFALTQYNRSYFYATAVADLAAELQARTGY
ncbi:lytic murein transglycosylase B [Bordetella pertussis]|uniref:lytic murein transglycosylase B n=1 Tax=Bordetella pertussis TaxID=520 RepID=UPI0036713605